VSVLGLARLARQERRQQSQQQQERRHPVDRLDAGEVGELAQRRGAEATQAEGEAEEHAGHQPDPPRQQLLRIDQDGREGRGHDHRHCHREHAGPE
jgi:hypothetical protein